MLKFIGVIAILLALPRPLLSENFSRIDSLSIQTPSETMRTMDDLVAYCETHAPNDLARVRFYFVWVATHIYYDETIGSNQQNPETVFNSRKAVCSGYSRLLGQLCEQSGIATQYVAGYGKEADDITSIQNHAWNLIRIDGKWHPFDVTWAANGLDDEIENLLSPAFDEWFMPPASVFQLTHLPFDPVYQLSDRLIKRGDFWGEPTEKKGFTEGVLNSDSVMLDGVLQAKNRPFADILNEEMGLDSMERTWRSFRRAYDYMPMDSAVAIKLAKAQEGKVKRVFEFVHQFSKKDYQNISQTATEVLKMWLEKLQSLEKPIEEALFDHQALESFPLSEANKRVHKQNYLFFEGLQNFAKKAIVDLNTEISARQ